MSAHPMQFVVLYAATALVFLVLDHFMLKKVLLPLFEKHIGDLLAPTINFTAAIFFYLIYWAGMMVFVSMPALRADAPLNALIYGFFLGAIAYGTYEFTNMATLKNWHWNMVMIDVTWGACLTAISAWAGVMIARTLG